MSGHGVTGTNESLFTLVIDDSSEEGFVGARYAVVRHTVALHDGHSPPEKDSYPTKEFKAKPTPGPRAKNMLQLDHVGASQPET